jgi:hypothetical protein
LKSQKEVLSFPLVADIADTIEELLLRKKQCSIAENQKDT